MTTRNDIKCIFFDLDNTLLPIDKEKFFPSYIDLFAEYVDLDAPKEVIVEEIWKSCNALYHNDGKRTNEEVFWSRMAQKFGDDVLKYMDRQSVKDFHIRHYNAIRQYVHPTETTPKVVDALKDAGYRLLIATNPFSPQIAQNMRTTWAGLDTADFEVITAYEDFHSCKPAVTYFSEILDKCGLEPTECVMVGNDVLTDMSAHNLGMDVFLVTTHMENDYNLDYQQYPQGSLADFCDMMTK